MRGSRVPSRRRSFALPVLALAALAIRLIYLHQLETSPLLSVQMGDSRVYDEWAQRLAGGQWLGTEIFYQTPLYPYALGVLFRLAGHDLDLIRVMQAVLGSVSCVLLALAGRRFFNPTAGLIAGAMLALYPPAIFFDGLIQKSSLDLFLVTLVLLLLAIFQDTRRWKWLIGAGAATGALVLNRENAFVLFPIVAIWLLMPTGDATLRRRGGWAACFLGLAFAVLVPVAVRNYRVGGELVLSTSQLGPNFYIGNNPHASGSYESLVPGRGDPIYERADATALASQAMGRALTPREVSGYWLQQAFAYIRAQPASWLKLTGRKLLLTINSSEISDTESIEAYAESAPILRGLLWMDFGIVLPLAAFGLWMHRHDGRQIILYLVGAGLLLSMAAFFVVARYRHPAVPVVLLFAAAGIGAVPAARRAGREWIRGAVAAVVVAIAAHVPMNVVHDQTFVNLGGYLARNGRPAEALPLLRKAVALDPGDPAAHAQLGLAFRDTGQPQPAADELATAVRLRPDYAEAHAALGLLLIDAGRRGDALAHLREAARLQPNSLEMRMNLGGALCLAEQFDECLVEYREAERIAPRSVEPPLFAARAYAAAGRLPDAAACLERAIKVANATGQADRARELEEMLRQTRAAIR